MGTIISHNILPAGCRLFLYGAWKSWKSMTVLDMSFSIASGVPWLGYATEPCPVHLVQLEIPKILFRNRVIKYADGHRLYPPNLWFTTAPYLKLDRDYGVSQLAREIEVSRPKVLILDPVYKILTGDVTSAYDVQKLLDNLDHLIDKYSLSLILVHHTRKSQLVEGEVLDRGAEELMGSAYFLYWCDTAIGIKRQGDADVTYHFSLMRHAEEELKPIHTVVDKATLRFNVRR